MNKKQDKWQFWVNGIIPLIVGIGMMLFPIFLPPPQGTEEITILFALIPLLYGAYSIHKYKRGKKSK